MESIENGSNTITMWNPKKGGNRAAMFVYVMTGLENVGFIANAASLVLYFMGVMHFDLTGSSTTLTNFMGSTFICTILGGFISDTYMTRLNTVVMFRFIEIMVMRIADKGAEFVPITVQGKKEAGSRCLLRNNKYS